jgi:UDP-glucose 4-epimerase
LRCLVTGGCGFIGSHLTERLLADGHEVTVLDDLSTGTYANVTHLEQNSALKLVIGSVLEENLVSETLHGCDIVFHLASAVGVKLIMERPVHTIETIFRGTDVVLNLAARNHMRVLLASTSEVYGKSDNVPFEEDGDRLEGPTSKHRWAYACAKALDEFLALAHWKESRLPVIVARLFNTVGPRQTGQYGMVVPNFVGRALENEPLVIHGDGRQSRCFAHVLDIVDALVALVDTADAYGQVINVGTDQEVTIRELAERVVQATGSASEIRHQSYEAAYGEGFEDMRRRVPSLVKLKRLVGKVPQRTLDEIIRDVAGHLRNQPE